jgi:salicylate hydroxylase
MEALVEAINKTPNISMKCGMRAKGIEEDDSGVTMFFADGTSSCGDLLIGCDGVHSFTRNYHVDPERNQVYTGLANAFGFVPLAEDQPVHFEVSALNFARRGMLLTSYYEHTKRSGYVGAIIEVPDVGSIDGWKARGGAQESVRNNITERFREAVLPAVHTFVRDAKDWFIWPIYSLPPLGKWATGRTILLGDAAHAMPPQGESTGIVLEDGILLARCLLRKQAMQGSIKEAFDAYEKLRRARINSAYRESQEVVNSVKDTGAFGHALKTFIIPIYLRYSRAEREKHFTEDVTTAPLGFGDSPTKAPPPPTSMLSLFQWLTFLLFQWLTYPQELAKKKKKKKVRSITRTD